MKKLQILSLVGGVLVLCLAGCTAGLSQADKNLLNQSLEAGTAASQSAKAAEASAVLAQSAAAASEASAANAADATGRAEAAVANAADAVDRAEAASGRAEQSAMKAAKAFELGLRK
jgi:hypothetical protein